MTDSETKTEKPESEEERLSDTAHSDELSHMENRLWGLNTAIRGLEEDCDDDKAISGVIRLAEDICEKMVAVHAAFEGREEATHAS